MPATPSWLNGRRPSRRRSPISSNDRRLRHQPDQNGGVPLGTAHQVHCTSRENVIGIPAPSPHASSGVGESGILHRNIFAAHVALMRGPVLKLSATSMLAEDKVSVYAKLWTDAHVPC